MVVKELWLIWRSGDAAHRSRYKVGILQWDPEADTYTFRYDHGDDLEAARKIGFVSFPGFEDLNKTYKIENKLFSNIAARLPKPERDDYLDILNRYDLDAFDKQFTILVATRGRQITDNFEFVPAFQKNKVEYDVAGVDHRQIDDLNTSVEEGYLVSGARLNLEREKNNRYDSSAIRILLPAGKRKVFIGYVPKYYSKYLAEKLDAGTDYSAVIAKVDLGSKIRDEKISAVVRLKFAE